MKNYDEVAFKITEMNSGDVIFSITDGSKPYIQVLFKKDEWADFMAYMNDKE
jgi:hypothetical protein